MAGGRLCPKNEDNQADDSDACQHGSGSEWAIGHDCVSLAFRAMRRRHRCLLIRPSFPFKRWRGYPSCDQRVRQITMRVCCASPWSVRRKTGLLWFESVPGEMVSKNAPKHEHDDSTASEERDGNRNSPVFAGLDHSSGKCNKHCNHRECSGQRIKKFC
jgi:hypothetical protein